MRLMLIVLVVSWRESAGIDERLLKGNEVPKSKGKPRAPKKGRPIDPARRRYCSFCKEKVDEVDYKDVAVLRRYVSDRGKIKTRRVTGACRRHQRQVAVAIKRAREMALLPYTASVAAGEDKRGGRRGRG
jgi:small subunit ribosomal protein S18